MVGLGEGVSGLTVFQRAERTKRAYGLRFPLSREGFVEFDKDCIRLEQAFSEILGL